MSRAPTIRSFSSHEWQTYKDLRLRSLADSPDAFGRTLAEERQRSDRDWSRRLESADPMWDLPLMAAVGGKPVGMIWGRIERSNPGVANVYQMWVAPRHRNQGVGQMLLKAAGERYDNLLAELRQDLFGGD